MENTNEMADELREEYDFSQMTGGVRGKYAKQCNAILNRIGIGIDVDKKYCELAKQRIVSAPELRQKSLLITEPDGK